MGLIFDMMFTENRCGGLVEMEIEVQEKGRGEFSYINYMHRRTRG